VSSALRFEILDTWFDTIDGINIEDFVTGKTKWKRAKAASSDIKSGEPFGMFSPEDNTPTCTMY